MKISCQSCEAKYTIADEKVRGKVVKIRCKKCSATIVVKGNELAAPVGADYDDAPTRVLDRDEIPFPGESSGDEWTLNVSDDDQRTASTAELLELYRSGVVDDDTYAWREGMDDWLPLREIQELRGLLPERNRASSVPADARGSAPSPSPSSARAAVRRPEARASSTDLFGAAAFAGSDSDVSTSAAAHPTSAGDAHHLTGARNESSVLFSLSALTGSATQARATADESSSIVDIKNLMGAPAAAPKKPSPASKVDDIMNLGGGGIFAPSLAAPVLSPASDEAATAGASAPAEASSKKNNGLLFGALGLAAAALLGLGAFFLLGGGDEAPKSELASAAAPTADSPAPPGASAPNPSEMSPSEAPTPTPAESAATAAAVAPASPPADAVQPAVAREKDKEPATAPAKAAEKPAPKPAVAAAPKPAAPAPKTAAPAPKPAAAPPPASSDAPPFDRAAALSSLNAASDSAAACKKPDGPTGAGRIAVTFAPSGVVTTANVEGPPFAGTAVGGCVAAKFRSARVPAFSGGMVTVRKSFTIN